MPYQNIAQFWSELDQKHIMGEHHEHGVLIERDMLIDSDRQIIEDEKGYRYARNIPKEIKMNSRPYPWKYFVFNQI